MQERGALAQEQGLAATHVCDETERGDDQHRVAEYVAAGDYALDRHVVPTLSTSCRAREDHLLTAMRAPRQRRPGTQVPRAELRDPSPPEGSPRARTTRGRREPSSSKRSRRRPAALPSR